MELNIIELLPEAYIIILSTRMNCHELFNNGKVFDRSQPNLHSRHKANTDILDLKFPPAHINFIMVQAEIF